MPILPAPARAIRHGWYATHHPDFFREAQVSCRTELLEAEIEGLDSAFKGEL